VRDTDLRGIDHIDAGAGNDTVVGSQGDDIIIGGAGGDTIIGGAGDDIIVGGSDTDTVVFRGRSTEYNILYNDDGSYTVEDTVVDRDGTDTVTDTENFRFADGLVAAEDLTLSAQLIDGAVEGVEYNTTSGLHGYTDKNGGFTFKAGDEVTFNVGGVTLGVATAEDVRTGQTFLQDVADIERTNLNDEYLENMATFLQSLDENGNAYDGIVVTDEVREALAGADIDLRNASEKDVRQLVEKIGKDYVSEEDAMEHVQDMLVDYTDLEESDFQTHISDGIDGRVQPAMTLSSTTAETVDTDSEIMVEDLGTIGDLSIDIPSLDLHEENGGHSYTTEDPGPVVRESDADLQVESVTDVMGESEQQSVDVQADGDLSHSLPAQSLSDLFDTSSSSSGHETQVDNDIPAQEDIQVSETVVEPEQIVNDISPADQQLAEKTEKTSITMTDDVEKEGEDGGKSQIQGIQEESLHGVDIDEEGLSLDTDDLHIELADENTEIGSEPNNSETESDLDRFTADTSAEEEKDGSLEQYSANGDLEQGMEMPALEALDTPDLTEDTAVDHVADAGLSVTDVSFTEEIPQESEQLEVSVLM